MQIGNFPITYLGLSLSSSKLKRRDRGLILDKISIIKKFNHWKNILPNISGRIELVVIYPHRKFLDSVLSNGRSIISKINSACANFTWKIRFHKMRWSDMCKPKEEGGFGIRRIDGPIQASSIKLLWRFQNSNCL